MFIAVTAVALIGLLASLVYLVEFAKASRGDALFLPASTGSARRARRVTGMYARGSVLDLYDDYDHGNDDHLVGH
ncbi:hypothetical protein GCM10010191_25570 [Actinomadura vinacea]|uniref:Uncharacterized protein n=1 Tax=Actinomadura vinacea TaxID=115336 RepID=A0ABP5VXD4_9ACTN